MSVVQSKKSLSRSPSPRATQQSTFSLLPSQRTYELNSFYDTYNRIDQIKEKLDRMNGKSAANFSVDKMGHQELPNITSPGPYAQGMTLGSISESQNEQGTALLPKPGRFGQKRVSKCTQEQLAQLSFQQQ